MLAILLSPLFRKFGIPIVVAAMILIAYSAWSYHLRSLGAEMERAAADARAVAEQQRIHSLSNEIDVSIAKESNTVEQLKKYWSR